MTPRELAGRGDLLDMIDAAVTNGTQQERADLLAAAAIRIRAMNAEHDAVCKDREAVKARLVEAEAIPAATPAPIPRPL